MQPEESRGDRTLVVQLARLGDLVQSLPAIEALRQAFPASILDAICAAPLTPVLHACPAIRKVLPWDGTQWRALADRWNGDAATVLESACASIGELSEPPYDRVYNLNQHARGVLLAHLLGRQTIGAGAEGPLASELTPWGAYLQEVARERAGNRVHLSDAWCGMCGVKPLGCAPRLVVTTEELPSDLSPIGQATGFWVALAIGAGDAIRCIPPAAWADWIQRFFERVGDGRVVLVGSGHEREAGQAIQDVLPPLLRARIWDTIGRTSLPQLMQVLARCRWVVGADTGPLHLATAVGTQALGFYFARARVHETGPYGDGHLVFQHASEAPPVRWPWAESIDVLQGARPADPKDWSLWESRLDRWGARFVSGTEDNRAVAMRESVWRALSPTIGESIAA